jgi:DNA modification methylase
MSKLRPNKDPGTDKALGSYAASFSGDEQLLTRGQGEASTGTSIFDPVLCELAYLWFSPKGGSILDPFAGGSVRGIVAGFLGRSYTGIELRPEQVAANVAQLATIKPQVEPRWIRGDGKEAATLASGEYDFVFTCPPYGDLERYSEDPADISTMAYPEFIAALREILAASIALLKPDRFACIVVGDFRDKKGFYRNFVSDTIAAMQSAGARLYNEAILVTAVGSLSIRAGRQFAAGRKLGKTHQQVLVFCKGDPAKATQACGTVEITIPDESFAEGLA